MLCNRSIFLRTFSAALLTGMLCTVPACVSPTLAQSLGMDVTAGTFGDLSPGPTTAGYSFTTSVPLTVIDLAFLDYESNGLANSHQVGLWNASGTLLVSVTFASGTGASSMPSAQSNALFRLLPITSLNLAPGTYMIGATYLNGDVDAVALFGNALPAPGITYGVDQWIDTSTSTLTFPSKTNPPASHTDAAFFGPSFVVASSTPEPGNFVIPTGLTVFGSLFAWRRIRRR